MATAQSAAATAPTSTAIPDLMALKTRQHAAWSSGDYAIVGTTLQIFGEELCEAMDLRPGQKVLGVAAGSGNVTLAAARRWCDVVSTDFAGARSIEFDRAGQLRQRRHHDRFRRISRSRHHQALNAFIATATDITGLIFAAALRRPRSPVA